jgi:hypothetical protein
VNVNSLYLALGLLLLETLEVLFFLDALFAPFVNVFLQLNLQLSSLLVLTVLRSNTKESIMNLLEKKQEKYASIYLEDISTLRSFIFMMSR